jgi:hypothetical protein
MYILFIRTSSGIEIGEPITAIYAVYYVDIIEPFFKDAICDLKA